MKLIVSTILSCIIFLASFQNCLVMVEYQINKDYYEALCQNKQKPEMQCNGKCQMKKEAEKRAPQNEIVKLSFEFNILPTKNLEVSKPELRFSEIEKPVFYHSLENVLKGFHQILPDPPQQLV